MDFKIACIIFERKIKMYLFYLFSLSLYLFDYPIAAGHHSITFDSKVNSILFYFSLSLSPSLTLCLSHSLYLSHSLCSPLFKSFWHYLARQIVESNGWDGIFEVCALLDILLYQRKETKGWIQVRRRVRLAIYQLRCSSGLSASTSSVLSVH